MKIQEMKQQLQTPAYDFLRTNPHMGKNIILLGLGGSYAYGTNTENSDLDVRGCAVNSKREILTGADFEQVCHVETDTTIYSFRKLIQLLSNCNPNTIEILGLEPEQYFYISPIGQELLDHKSLFLSQKAIQSFGGYANSQLRRLDNKSARLTGQAQREQHILNSIQNASYDFKGQYFSYTEDNIHLYLDSSPRDDMEAEIYMDLSLKHYPLRDYRSMWNEMNSIVRDYDKLGKRNKHAIEHAKLSKHMMHLVRLYLMAFDILEKGEIHTYRKQDLPFLMEIRNGKFLDENQQPTEEFSEFLDELQKRLNYAKENTDLPEVPDVKQIDDFVASVHERIVRGEV